MFLTDQSGDANTALNPDNIMVVHHECYNQIRGRFGYQFEQGVYNLSCDEPYKERTSHGKISTRNASGEIVTQ